MKKAQAAMEFLTTYGWALLILVVGIAVLVYSGILNVPKPHVCSFTPNIQCGQNVLNTQGAFGVYIEQTTGQDINVTYLICSTQRLEDIDWNTVFFVGCSPNCNYARLGLFDTRNGGGFWKDEGLIIPHGGRVGFGTFCLDENGHFITGAQSSYKTLYLYMNYTELDTNVPHIVTGKLSTEMERLTYPINYYVFDPSFPG